MFCHTERSEVSHRLGFFGLLPQNDGCDAGVKDSSDFVLRMTEVPSLLREGWNGVLMNKKDPETPSRNRKSRFVNSTDFLVSSG